MFEYGLDANGEPLGGGSGEASAYHPNILFENNFAQIEVQDTNEGNPEVNPLGMRIAGSELHGIRMYDGEPTDWVIADAPTITLSNSFESDGNYIAGGLSVFGGQLNVEEPIDITFTRAPGINIGSSSYMGAEGNEYTSGTTTIYGGGLDMEDGAANQATITLTGGRYIGDTLRGGNIAIAPGLMTSPGPYAISGEINIYATKLILESLPVGDPHVPGYVYTDGSGNLKISLG